MLAVTLVAGVVAVGVSVAVMSSETTEKERAKADVKYLEAKQPFNFGRDRASVDNFRKLRDDRLVAALKDPRVDLQFVRDLSNEQVANMVRYAGTADVILGMPEMQRLSLVDRISAWMSDRERGGEPVGAHARVVATVLSISPRAASKMTNDDGVAWYEVLRQLLELHERAQPDIKGNVQNQVEAILKASPELARVPETFVESGAAFLRYIRHDAIAHVLHAFDSSSVSKLYNCAAVKNLTSVDIDMVKARLGPARSVPSDPIFQLLMKTSVPTKGDIIRERINTTDWESGKFDTKIRPGAYAGGVTIVEGKATVSFDPTTYQIVVTFDEVRKLFLLTQLLEGNIFEINTKDPTRYDDAQNTLYAEGYGYAIPPKENNLKSANNSLRKATENLRFSRAATTKLQIRLDKADVDALGRRQTDTFEFTKF